MPQSDPPTPMQQRYLRSLAEKTGTSFTPPTTKAEASSEIARLRNRSRSAAYERRADREVIEEGLERRGGDSAVRSDEIEGYGSTARWR